MFNLDITNGGLRVVNSGSLIIQDINSPIDFKLQLPDKSHVGVRVKFTETEDLKDAGIDLMPGSEDYNVGLTVKIPKGNSHMSAIDKPLWTVGDEKIFLAVGWTKNRIGVVRFDYTFSVTEGLLSGNRKKGKQ